MIKRATMLLALCWCCFLPQIVQAQNDITIVLSAPTQTNLEFIEVFKQTYRQSSADAKIGALKINVIDLAETDKLSMAENSDLVIALGVKALEATAKLKPTTPVLGVYVPLPVFHTLMEKNHRELGNFSAIVLDQPYARQLAFVNLILPEAKKLGVILGSTSARYEDDLREQAEKSGFNINAERINQSADLIPKLNQLLQSSDALLAVADSTIYNRETAQPILLTSYRYQKPVFAYSLSYVKAGALAAIYTNTEQIAKQAVELVHAAQQAQHVLLPPQTAKYFTVAINPQVARALNISVKDEEIIRKQLMRLEPQ